MTTPTGKAWITSAMAAAVALTIVASGCAKDHEHDADVDPGADWSGDVTPDDATPDVPSDTAVETPEDSVTDTVADTVADNETDTPVETTDTPADGVVQCRCADAGVVLVPDAGCSTWPDATECTGWHSVIDPDGDGTPALTDLFDDGSQYCAYGCCITIQCP